MFDLSTIIILVIVGFFAYFCYFLYRIYRSGKKRLERICNADDLLESIVGDGKLAELGQQYGKLVNIPTDQGDRTNLPAGEIFSMASVCRAIGVNLRMLDAVSGILVGLGLFGTFLGLTIGIRGFDSSDTSLINESIQKLLSGMNTAFITSLAGMGFSVVFILLDKHNRNGLQKAINRLNDKLDNAYYVDDAAVASLQQQNMIEQLQVAINQAIEERLTYQTADGHQVPIANAVREILAENQEQSKALKSFSTDLAMELNNGFDEVLSRQMQEKILPLMENVDKTTREVVAHIDRMSEQMTSPISDMIEAVIGELRDSMAKMLSDFNSNISGSAINELESLAQQLGTAAHTMADFPKSMEQVSATLQVTINEVRGAVAEIANTSATANSTAMQQMQEQISAATAAISSAITEVKQVMDGLTNSSQEQAAKMVSNLTETATKIGAFLDKTIESMSASMKQSFTSLSEELSSRQVDIIALQEDAAANNKKLLEAFNGSLDRLENMNTMIERTMDMFQQAQGRITGSTAHLQSITDNLKMATQLFNTGQSDYAAAMQALQQDSQQEIDALAELLTNSGSLSKEYVEKFDVIRNGLSAIFQQLQSGLTEYSRTVQSSTQKYLEQYSTNLTQTTGALASAISQQNDMMESLVNALDNIKK